MTRLKIVALALVGSAVLLAVAVWLTWQLPAFGGAFEADRQARMRQSKQFINGRFENTPSYISDLSVVREVRSYFGDEVRQPQSPVPVLPLDPEALKGPVLVGLRTWWLGHASVLIELDGVRILTDPMLSERASPFQFAGPARLHPPPLALARWTGIDAVVISHDHFDHLDMDTVTHLARGGTQFYVGLGIGAHLQRWSVPREQIHELDWWQQADLQGLQIHCTPARHYSGRKSMDNSTLWASWMIRGPAHAVYYSGDTGYAGHFRTIRERLGAPQLAIVKIGAYGDSWLDIHMHPESAVQAHIDLGAQVLLPVHWATFNLAYHAWAEPIVRTLAAADSNGVRVITPRVGEKFEFGTAFESTSWFSPKTPARKPGN
jgi:L-ascorbate metabolism protein UlaG (beta-lactamase superfamily)